jgi:single-stranded-DNA-specific exonuclease
MLVRELAVEAARRSLDLCALGTIADQVPLVEANRTFAVEGLEALRRSGRVGIQVLLEQAKIVQADLNTGSVNYSIAPRINAMGRLKHGMDALRLLCTTSIDRAWQLAQTLQETNQDRQTLTEEMLQHALLQAESWKDERVIVVASETYHEGVIGLIAGKLTEKYSKPSVVIAIGESTAKGSARSIPSVDVTELLRLVRHQLLEVGGHAMAAGLSVAVDKVEAFSAEFRQLAASRITIDQLEPRIDIECTLPAQLCTVETALALQQFAPFGQGNREPMFQLLNAQVLSKEVIGREGTHLKLVLQLENDTKVTALWWGKAQEIERIPLNGSLSLAAKLLVNVWKGRLKLNFELQYLR